MLTTHRQVEPWRALAAGPPTTARGVRHRTQTGPLAAQAQAPLFLTRRCSDCVWQDAKGGAQGSFCLRPRLLPAAFDSSGAVPLSCSHAADGTYRHDARCHWYRPSHPHESLSASLSLPVMRQQSRPSCRRWKVALPEWTKGLDGPGRGNTPDDNGRPRPSQCSAQTAFVGV